ncbi:MAG: hypothetical protein ABL986_16680 [Vicinamibacterales bacterium]
MRSRSADSVEDQRHQRLAAMTPDERVALLGAMYEQGLTTYMLAQGVARSVAVARIKATRRLGRRPSASGDV